MSELPAVHFCDISGRWHAHEKPLVRERIRDIRHAVPPDGDEPVPNSFRTAHWRSHFTEEQLDDMAARGNLARAAWNEQARVNAERRLRDTNIKPIRRRRVA